MLPEGWKESPDMALGLVENIFFPFKTPLSKASGNFTIQDVFDYAKEKNWSIGLWIDLTNTSKYYKGAEVARKGVQYVKLPLAGRQSPSMKEIIGFNNVCDGFLKRSPGGVIGIHCTHGFNRTGFLICAFLSQVKKLDVHEALRVFAERRPPGIYRQNMVDDIVGYFGAWGCPPPPKVSNPPWKVGNTWKVKSLGGSTKPGPGGGLDLGQYQSPGKKKSSHEIRKITPGETFQEYLANYSIEIKNEMQETVLEDVRGLTGMRGSESILREHQQFTEKEFESLKSQPCMVSWFPQEYFRYLLYFNAKSNVYLIDASNRVFPLAGLIFPSDSSPSKRTFSTLIEGIIIRKYISTADREPDPEYHFEVSDVFAFEGRILTGEGLGSRLKLVRGLLDSRKLLGLSRCKTGPSIDLPTDPFRIRIQPMWSAAHFWKLQRFDWFNSYPVGPNGLIFYPINSSQTPRAVKWMCPTTKNACFRLRKDFVTTETNPVPTTKFHICTDDREKPFDELKYDTDEEFNLYDSLVGHIIACAFDSATESWKFRRQAIQRTWSDTHDFVECIRSGELAKNVPTKQIFDYYGSQKQAKRVNSRWNTVADRNTPNPNAPSSTTNALYTSGIENDIEGDSIKKIREENSSEINHDEGDDGRTGNPNQETECS